MTLNYIDQINVFWLLDAEHLFNGNETRLYFYLLKLSNSLYWKNPLTNADGYTASMVGISVNTLKTARNRLQQAGLIKFTPGGNGARNKCIYQIIEASKIVNKVSKSDTLSANSLTPYPQPNLQNTDDINKHKPEVNQTDSDTIVSGGKKKSGKDKAPKEEGKKSSAQKKKEESTPHWQDMVNAWFEFNRKELKFEPSFKGQDPRSLKGICDNLQKRAADKGHDWTKEKAVSTLQAFLTHAYGESWLKGNFLLSNLDRQFDKIVSNASTKNRSAAANSDYEQELANRLAGITGQGVNGNDRDNKLGHAPAEHS